MCECAQAHRCVLIAFWRGEDQNREEGEMAQKKLGGGRKCEVNV